MIRVVADANVLISAALGRSAAAPSALVLEATLDQRLELVSSPRLLQEIASVLGRPRLRRYLSLEESERFVADLASQTTLVADAAEPFEQLCRDPADDYLIALAVVAEVEAIVTGDLDLLELASPPVAVITPRELATRVAALEEDDDSAI